MVDSPQHSAGNSPEKASPEVAARFNRLVRDLVWELHPEMQRRVAVTLDSDLDRDLGLDSLGRAELVLRIDRAFKVRLPDQLLADASTPRDLLQALFAAAPHSAAAMEALPPELTELPEVVAPFSETTLIGVLAQHVHSHGERPHVLLWRSEDEEETISYAKLDRESRAVAAGLIERGLEPGDRVAIMLPTEAVFFEAFFGVLYAGGVPVPVYPPFRRAQVEDHLRRQATILRNAGASFLIIGSEIHTVGQLMLGLAEDLRHVATVKELSRAGAIEQPLAAGPDTIALIQYTSGSTGDPKGVVLTHANLLANIRGVGEALAASSSDVFVSWLPLYHDMGLIGAWLGALHYGVPTVIMPPLAFLADPGRWLRAIGHHRATLSAAPNFAYELCCKNVHDEDIKGLDLSSLRMLMNGAEPVSPGTIARFTAHFAKFGFRPEAMAPVYGLAENSVGLTCPPVGRGPIVDRVERSALSRDGKARTAQPGDATALEFVACGRPIAGHEIRIVDEAGGELPERTEGRLQFKGPSATQGYFRNEEKTKALFDGEWLESGDRAYIAGGDVFITGRIKDMIIKAGRNIYPQELEELVGGLEGVRKGCVAAFPSTLGGAGTERLVLLVETRLTAQSDIEALRSKIIDVAKTRARYGAGRGGAGTAQHRTEDLQRQAAAVCGALAIRERVAFEKGPCALVATDETVFVGAWPSRPPAKEQDFRTSLCRLLVGAVGRGRQHDLVCRPSSAAAELAPRGHPLCGAQLLMAHGAIAQGRGRRADPCAGRAARRQPCKLSRSSAAFRGDSGPALLRCQGGAGGPAGRRSIPAPHRYSVRAQNRRGGRR